MTPSGGAPASNATDRDRGAIFAWLYLAVVVAFLALAVWFNNRDSTTAISVIPIATTTTSSTLAPIPAEIEVVVDRKIATISGAVPDEGARAQLIRIAEDRFGNGNVIDELTVDPGIDLKTGVINFSGIADEGDLAPEQLLLNAGADLGLAAGRFDLEFVEPQFEPAVIEIVVGELPVVVTGTVPTESDRDRLVQSAEAVYGEGNVDVAGVVVEPSDIENATITISGLTRPGDTSSTDLVAILQTDFRTAELADDSEIDLSDEALTVFEAELEAILAEKPILFDTGTSKISDEGSANLLVIAEAIQALPDLGVEIIGHTDDTGGDTVNQTLSENRAVSVREALVELGIDADRLTTSGRGSSEPAVPNTSAENRARNRRIQFIFDRG
ncbi:MAG: OmpA family protein [Acidimicrobiales bacterium]|nr:OmpA family protein [Acidimicrobiales bacterium]